MRTDKKLKNLPVSAAIVDDIEIPVEKTYAINVAAVSSKTKSSRKRKVSSKMDDHATVDHGYEYAATAPDVESLTVRQQKNQDKFTPMYFAVINTMLLEFNKRFSERNLQLIGAVNHTLDAE